MEESRYNIIFRGEIVDGQNIHDVRQRLASLYKTTSQKIETRFFKETPAFIKQNLAYAEAIKYKSLLEKTGIICSMELANAKTNEPVKDVLLSKETYSIVFSGEIRDNYDVERVKKDIAALYKISLERCEKLFTGQPIELKRNIDYAAANKYQKAFERTGAICYIKQTVPVTEQDAPKKQDDTASEVNEAFQTETIAIDAKSKADQTEQSQNTVLEVKQPQIVLLSSTENKICHHCNQPMELRQNDQGLKFWYCLSCNNIIIYSEPLKNTQQDENIIINPQQNENVLQFILKDRKFSLSCYKIKPHVMYKLMTAFPESNYGEYLIGGLLKFDGSYLFIGGIPLWFNLYWAYLIFTVKGIIFIERTLVRGIKEPIFIAYSTIPGISIKNYNLAIPMPNAKEFKLAIPVELAYLIEDKMNILKQIAPQLEIQIENQSNKELLENVLKYLTITPKIEDIRPLKWYENKIIVHFLLLFIYPVGLYALWKSPRISKIWKVMASGIFGFIFWGAWFGQH